jgi:hypothetical protein
LAVRANAAAAAATWVSALAPSFAQTAPEPVTKLLAELDDAFTDGGADRYLSHFEPVHAELHSTLATWLRSALDRRGWRRSSNIVQYVTRGDCGIARVETRLEPSRNGTPDDVVTATRLLVVRDTGGAVRPTLEVEADARALDQHASPTEAFGCQACNYVIAAGKDWLFVPHLPARVGCLEAVSFYALHWDIALDVSVHVEPPDGPNAKDVLTALVDEIAGDCAWHGDCRPWVPPHYERNGVPAGLEGAACRVERGPGRRAELFVVAFGPMRYLLALHGAPQAMEDHRAEIDELLGSFALRDTDLGSVARSLRPVQKHTGGELRGGKYENAGLGVSFDGPPGWTAQLRCGPHLFHVIYRAPDGSGRIDLRGLGPPSGRRVWTTRCLDRTLDGSLLGQSFVNRADTGWRELETGCKVREIEGDTASSSHALRCSLDAERALLIVLDAAAERADLLPDLRRAFDRLEQR